MEKKRVELLREIKDTQRAISNTDSNYRKNDLKRHLNNLWKEYRAVKKMIEAEGATA